VISVRDKAGSWVGALQLHSYSDEDEDFQGKELEIVEVARGTTRVPGLPQIMLQHIAIDEWWHPERPCGSPPDEYHFYWVMYIKRSGEIAYREGLGRISVEAWVAQEKSEIELILG
jgi:hypothetical protein